MVLNSSLGVLMEDQMLQYCSLSDECRLHETQSSRLCHVIYIYIYISPPWGLSTLVKEFSAAARIMQSSSKELSTLVADRV